jgi:hypothetical protein
MVLLKFLEVFHSERPDWDKCADFVNGGITSWKDLSQDKSTNECVDVLLNEIAAGDGSDACGAEYFDGKANIIQHLTTI